ncbi:hypothetical protein ABMA75_04150 [Halobacteriovorax sp. ZH4_bin.1]|uniref:hypothetical protein n=1 Tax=unclassified Halobacteriovorax TaxID=2639665 RepID=UPI00371287A2
MGKIKTIIIFLILISSFVFAEELIVKPNQVQYLSLKKFKKESDTVYSLYIKKLTLNNESVLFLPNELSNKIATITIDELHVHGKGYIAQSVRSNVSIVRHKGEVGLKEYYADLIPRAQKGKDGDRVNQERAPSGDGDKGRDGKHGKNGRSGMSGIKELSLDINIASFGQLDVVLVAESGGHGGHGSDGQGGSHAECDRNRGANGGHGGNGGQGGFPGSVGSVNIKWQSDLPLITTGQIPFGLNVRQYPGLAGNPGNGGVGGSGGNAVRCALWKRSGGDAGENGRIGTSLRGGGDYIFYGRIGDVSIINKDLQ